MTLSQAIKQSGLERREAEDLLAFVLKRDRAYAIAHADEELPTKVAEKFLGLCERRLKNEPFAYIVGYQPFLGHDFLVNKNTLIPRPETEGLAERAIERAKIAHRLHAKPIIVDIGTGSGCIAISAALACPFATVIASDVSDGALTMARKNAKRLNASVKFVKDDLLGQNVERQIVGSQKKNSDHRSKDLRLPTYDLIIVSNPPYLPSSDKKTMARDVVKYEPSTALFAGKDGTNLIVKLLKQLNKFSSPRRPEGPEGHDRPDGLSLFLEIDPSQTDKLKKLASELFPKHLIKIERDWCGRDRYLIILEP